MATFPSLYGSTHPKRLNLAEFGGLWRPSHLMQHFITVLLGKIAPTQPGSVLGHLVFGVLLGSPLAVAKAAAALPGVHMKHNTE